MRTSAVAFWALLSISLAQPATHALDLQLERSFKLTGALAGAADVRFDSSGRRILLAAPSAGAFSIASESKDGHEAAQLLGAGTGARQLWLTSLVANSAEISAVAAPAFQLMAFATEISGEPTSFEIASIEDIDARGPQLAVLGLMRDPVKSILAPDGAIVWVSTRSGGKFSPLAPVAFALTGYGAVNFAACNAFMLAGVRFMSDGSLIVVPGAEPGVYRIDPKAGGRILQSWDTQKAAIGAPCDRLSIAEQRELAGNPESRWKWLNRFETVEDVLGVGDRAFLVTRTVDAQGTHFALHELLKDGTTKRQNLPMHTPSTTGHLRADAFGSRVVFLQFTYGMPQIENAEIFLMKASE